MPTMIRWNPKANKIAFSILGKPAGSKKNKTAAELKIDKTVLSQYTSQVR